MEDICPLVPSQKGKDKINVKGYLMVKNKQCRDLFYWNCEFRQTNGVKCSGFASTILVAGEHHLRSQKEHNHGPEASRADVAVAVASMKESGRATNDKPAQIINNLQMLEDSRPCLPSREAIRKRIKRARREDAPPEPSSVMDLNINEAQMKTLNGVPFRARDSIIGEDRTLLFCTAANVRKLSEAQFWIMDGTFKTVPTIFKQMYSIHGLVGTGANARILPLAYGLLTSKSQACYSRMFQVRFSSVSVFLLNKIFIRT
jgi:FLYWCH-type zinc finger protein